MIIYRILRQDAKRNLFTFNIIMNLWLFLALNQFVCLSLIFHFQLNALYSSNHFQPNIHQQRSLFFLSLLLHNSFPFFIQCEIFLNFATHTSPNIKHLIFFENAWHVWVLWLYSYIYIFVLSVAQSVYFNSPDCFYFVYCIVCWFSPHNIVYWRLSIQSIFVSTLRLFPVQRTKRATRIYWRHRNWWIANSHWLKY